MKYCVLLILFLIGFCGTAQEQEIEIDLDDFQKVKVDSGLEVKFTRSNENKAIITGKNKASVRINNRNGILSITSTLLIMPEGDSTVVNVFYKQLKKLEVMQNSDVEFCSKVEQQSLMVRASEGSSVYANLDVENLNARAIMGGNLKFIGKAENQVINIKTKGDFRGENLIGENVRVELKGGGVAYIFSTEYVWAKARAGGKIYISGNPEKVVKSSGIGATIEKIN